jgi:hypothetical protein
LKIIGESREENKSLEEEERKSSVRDKGGGREKNDSKFWKKF